MAMTVTHDYASDYGGEPSDYQTTMSENLSETIDYESLTRGKLRPLKAGVIKCRADGEPPRAEYIGGQCDGPRCA